MEETIIPIQLGKDADLNWMTEQDSEHLGFNCWDPEEYVKRGWRRRWGDAAVMSPYFEVLLKQEDRCVRFLILCPTFLRRPLEITCFPDGEGSY